MNLPALKLVFSQRGKAATKGEKPGFTAEAQNTHGSTSSP
jgi:hypothetical protein